LSDRKNTLKRPGRRFRQAKKKYTGGGKTSGKMKNRKSSRFEEKN